MGTLNSPQTLRRTLKPRTGGAAGFPIVIIASIVGVLLIGGGIGYAVETGQRHAAQAPAQVGLDAVVPALATFTSVTPVTHLLSPSKKPAKHHAAPSSQASPAVSPTPASTPSAAPALTTAAGKVVASKHVTHHVKQSALTTLAFDPAAAAQAPTPNPIPAQATAQPAATAPPAAATPQPTPIYEPAVVVDARFVSQVQPIYPEIPKSQGIQGTAIVLVTVGPGGNVISLSIGQSTGNRLLDAAALEAARSSRFQAPEVDGHPATQTYRIVYTFAL